MRTRSRHAMASVAQQTGRVPRRLPREQKSKDVGRGFVRTRFMRGKLRGGVSLDSSRGGEGDFGMMHRHEKGVFLLAVWTLVIRHAAGNNLENSFAPPDVKGARYSSGRFACICMQDLIG